MEAIIIHPKTKEQTLAFEQMAKALKIPFENVKAKDLPEREKAIRLYGKKFVEKIETSDENFKKGKFKTMELEDLIK